EHLNGMFAMAIWDGRTGKLHLIRDRYGIKPLFYHNDGRFFRFASEIKAILADDRVLRRPSIQAMHDLFTFAYVPGRQTAFEDIYELPPAHYMTLGRDGSVEEARYWDLRFESDESIDANVAARKSLELMDNAVQGRLIADVPVGALLSGGLDSSTLVALMHRHTDEPIHTYSVGFEDQSFNELPYARIIAEQFGTVHRETMITPERVLDLLPRYLTYIDEPYADGSAIPTYCVCEIAKDEVVVVLSGEGGDEIFAGYETYSAFKVSRWFRHVPRWARHGLIAPVVNRLPVSHKKLSLEFKMKRFLGGQDLPPAEAHLWWRILLTEAQKRALYSAKTIERLADERSDRHFTDAFGRSGAKHVLSGLMYIDSTVFLPDDLMIKNDRMSMAHSLEARVPMTDPELTQFMATVPPRVKFPRLRKKHILRRAMQNVLTPTILNKKKVGLEIPYSRWFLNEFRSLLMKYCDPSRIAETGLFRPEAVTALVEDHLEGRRDNGRILWAMLNFMMWLELYIPNPNQ
ncbi:MAG: asparagine synthase (glutamine-hydrolyzing), partial [Planctomycetota bacterium]